MPLTRNLQYTIQEIFNKIFDDDTNTLMVATTLPQKIAGEDLVNDVQKVEQRFQYANLTAAAVKTGAGVLHAIVVNSTAAGTISVFDNSAASGTTIATLKASIGEASYRFDAAFATGLTVVLAGASNVTIVYR